MMWEITAEGIGVLSQRISKEFGYPDASGELLWNFSVMPRILEIVEEI